MLNDPVYIQDHNVTHYKTLLSSNNNTVNTGLVEKVMSNLVTDEENVALLRVHLLSEVYIEVKSLDPSSSPDLDGFNGYFYTTCLSIVSLDKVLAIQSCIQSCFIHEKIPLHFNSNLVVLINTESFEAQRMRSAKKGTPGSPLREREAQGLGRLKEDKLERNG